MLNDIQENPELLDMFDDMCLIWWNKKGLINIIKNIVSKYFDKNSNTYNISIHFKMSLQSLIDSPKELLELIMKMFQHISGRSKNIVCDVVGRGSIWMIIGYLKVNK